MTVLVKHIKKEGGLEELVFRNGKNTVLFSLGDDKGKSGVAFDIYKGKESFVGFNLLGQKMGGPYNYSNNDKKRFSLSGFEAEGRATRYCYVEGTEGHLNHAIFTVDKEPFNHITFCDGDGNRAIDINLDKEGTITSISRAGGATTRDNLVVMLEDENNPKLNKTVDLNKTSYDLDGRKSAGLKAKVAGLAPKTTTRTGITR